MGDLAGLGLPVWVSCFAIVIFAVAVQRLSGQGFGLIAAPLIALVAPQLVPAALLLIGVVAGLGSAALDLAHVNRRELPWGFSGRAFGAFVAAWLATLLPGFEEVAVMVALFVLAAVALSLSGVTFAITRPNLAIAGFSAGIMGTLTAIGAPPMALLYQQEEPARARAMQSTFFFFGMAISILALTVNGLITATHLTFALTMLPAVGIALLISQPLAKRIRKSLVRPMALMFSTIAALVLLARHLLF